MIDERGRIFGKINVIDAVVAATVLLLIPLAYGAYLLFRTPPVRLIGVEPASVTQGVPQVTLRGEHLRPYLRLSIGGFEAKLLFQNPSSALVQLPPELPIGSHELVLADEGQELGRLPGGLTVVPALVPVASLGAPDVHPEVVAIGAFRGLEAAAAKELSTQLAMMTGQSTTWGTVRGVLPPEMNLQYLEPAAMAVTDSRYQIRAVLSLQCTVEAAQCLAGGAAVAPHATVPVKVGERTLGFVVDEVQPAGTQPLIVTLRVTVPEPLFEQLRQPPADPARKAFDDVRASVWRAGPLFRPPDGTQAAAVQVRVPVLKTTAGWIYRGKPLHVGDSLQIENERYAFAGSIVAMQEAGDR